MQTLAGLITLKLDILNEQLCDSLTAHIYLYIYPYICVCACVYTVKVGAKHLREVAHKNGLVPSTWELPCAAPASHW